MTEILSKEFSRKAFVKGGGALIVAFSTFGAAVTGKAQAADSPYASNGPGDMYQLDAWLSVHAPHWPSPQPKRGPCSSRSLRST